MKIKKGMMVRISKTLTHTKRLWGLNEHMRKMQGTIRKVIHINSITSGKTGEYSNCIYIADDHGNEWSFSERDLTIPKETPPAKPVMFDPKNI